MDTLTLNIRDQKRDPVPFFIAPALHDQWQWWLKVFPFRIDEIFWIVDATVDQLHSKILEYYQDNVDSGPVILFPSGESHKSRRFRDALEDVLLTASPTTLLAQVDSCLGGKVSINHPYGKNLLGTYHHPRAVFIRTRFLRTLPWAQWVNGLAEVIKYALLFDLQLLTTLKKRFREIRARDSVWIQRIIRRFTELQALLERYPEPSILQLLNADPDELWRWMQYDKKSDQEVRCTLLYTTGNPCLYHPVSQSQFLYAWEALQKLPLVLDQFDPGSVDLSKN